MADSYFKMNGNVMIQRKSGIDSQFFHGPNHDFEIRAENSPIIGTTNSSENNATSDQLAIYNGNTKLWGITEGGWVVNPNVPIVCIGRTETSLSLTAGTDAYATTNVFYDVIQGITHNTNTGTFTVPVSGIYYISYWSIKYTIDAETGYMQIKINGAEDAQGTLRPYSNINPDSISWATYSAEQHRLLSAGDYINVISQGNADYTMHGRHHSRFTVKFIG